jgi:hypothetical protein
VTERSVVVGRNAVATVAGLRLGILVMNPDHDDPAARLAIVDTRSGEERAAEVRPGDLVTIGGRTIYVTGVTPGRRTAGKVDLIIAEKERPDNGLDERPDGAT